MKTAKKTSVPTLDDVVIPGKELSEINESPLNETELMAIEQQL